MGIRRKLGGGKTKPAKKASLSKSDIARTAVDKWEQERDLLLEMREDFDNNFPEAAAALRELQEQEDRVQEAAKAAHPLVQQARETIGDFKCVPKFSKPHYDTSKVTKLLEEDEESRSEVVDVLFEAGIVKKLELDQDKATPFFAQQPDLAEYFQEAWKEQEEKTAAVTIPKI